jgi:protein-disulfide isomerase
MKRSALLFPLFVLGCEVEAAPPAIEGDRALVAHAGAHPDEPANCKNAVADPPAGDARVKIDLQGAPILGNGNAPVTVVVFSDFECPFCRKGADRIRELEAKYPTQVRFAFKHLPLPFHERARPAAIAAIAAAKEGKFWELHDRFFANQRELDDVGAHLKAVGLVLDEGKKASAETQLERDGVEAKRLGVTGTPTFFVNGKRLTGAQPLETFTAMIDAELAER